MGPGNIFIYYNTWALCNLHVSLRSEIARNSVWPDCPGYNMGPYIPCGYVGTREVALTEQCKTAEK